VFFFGIGLFLVTRFPAARWALIVTAMAVIWSVGFALQSQAKPLPWNMYAAEAQKLESALSRERQMEVPQGAVFDEAIVYYTFGQMLTLGNDRWDDLLRTANTS
jgi:hypothetical protein